MTCTKAYISGIRNEHNEDDLGSYFSKFGDIENVEIIVDHVTNEKRGFAFVTFTDYDAVDKIVCKYCVPAIICIVLYTRIVSLLPLLVDVISCFWLIHSCCDSHCVYYKRPELDKLHSMCIKGQYVLDFPPISTRHTR